MKKNKAGDITLPDFEPDYRNIAIKTVRYRHKKRNKQTSGTEAEKPEPNPRTWFTRLYHGHQEHSWAKDNLFHKCCWETQVSMLKMTNLDPHLTRYRELTFGYDTKARATKAQILTRATPNGSFFTAKETINKMKRQTAEWEKMFVNHSSDKEVISKIKKELIQLNSKKNANMQLKNGQNTDFIKKDTQRNSLVVHWLGLCTCTAGSMGSIPGQGTNILHATWHSKQKKRHTSDQYIHEKGLNTTNH